MLIIRSPPKAISMSYTKWRNTSSFYPIRRCSFVLESGKTALNNCWICFIVAEFWTIQKLSLRYFFVFGPNLICLCSEQCSVLFPQKSNLIALLLFQTKKKNNSSFSWDIHFWLGSDTSQVNASFYLRRNCVFYKLLLPPLLPPLSSASSFFSSSPYSLCPPSLLLHLIFLLLLLFLLFLLPPTHNIFHSALQMSILALPCCMCYNPEGHSL